jgi:hypothetical protein
MPLNVLIACEESGVVRDAFAALGHNAWSCDLMPTRRPGQHWQGDVRDCNFAAFDLMIAHPPCDHLAVSGSRWFEAKRADGRQQAAVEFFRFLADAPVPMKCIENPVCIMSSHYRKPDQIIQPWQFGHGETKATCLWLTGLPALVPTEIVGGRADRIHKMPPGPNRKRDRSETYVGIARAMADQWGGMVEQARVAA